MADFKEECIRDVKSIAEQINELSTDYEKFNKYFDDVLDVEYRIASDGSYRGAYIYLTLGGPNIWVDTLKGSIELRSGTESVGWFLNDEVLDMIDEKFNELYSNVR